MTEHVKVTPNLVFVPNPDLVDELVAEPETQAAKNEYADLAAHGARAVGAAIADTGAYARSIEVDGDTVYSTDPGAIYIEFGSANNPPFAPLRRGVDQTGCTMTDDEGSTLG